MHKDRNEAKLQVALAKEQRFYRTLKDLFVGAKIEGESGYINLMRIKSRYFEKGVFPELKKDIGKVLSPFPDFKEELFDKLYTFFNRYFSESGSIYFRRTHFHQNIYEKVYTDDKDVMLFWKTHMLYYVKTDRLFKNLEVEIDGQKFFFDVSELEHKKAFEKRALIYEFKEKKRAGTLVFSVSYTEKGRKTKINEILRSLKKAGVKITEETLESAFRLFEKQSEVDYFINKNAKAFLKEQFDLWLYQYVFQKESEWTEKRIKQLQVLKNIAFKIIDFISQFEDELVKIWNKPKFVLNSNYVITLDRIAEKDRELKLIEKILKTRDPNVNVGLAIAVGDCAWENGRMKGKALETFVKLLSHKDLRIREGTAFVLGENAENNLTDERILSPLFDLLSDDNPTVRAYAIFALGAYARRGVKKKHLVQKLLAATRNSEDDVRETLKNILFRLELDGLQSTHSNSRIR